MSRRLLNPDTDADRQVRRILDNPEISGFTVIAGAGSGKTTSLVKALHRVIESRGTEFLADRRQVACVTYTEVATREIEEDLARNPIAHVSTIHSFLWTLVEPFQQDIHSWVMEYGNNLLDRYRTEFRNLGPKTTSKKRAELSRRISRLLDGLAKVDDVTRFRYGVARNYGEGVVGHDEILKMVPELILGKPLFARLLARRFPFVFVDESQDTFPQVVKCLRHVAITEHGHFCLGFFGDPMQQIYLQGAGDIVLEPDWEDVQKPENFRSPQQVLEVVNAIRSGGDDLIQVSGLSTGMQRAGEVTYFVFPANEQRAELLDKARAWLEAESKIGAWRILDGADPAKVLVITHRMAARRMGFQSLYDAFHGTRLGEDFDEGRAWPLTPFLGTLLPLAAAAGNNRLALLPLLRRSSPLLRPEALTMTPAQDALNTLAAAIEQLRAVLTAGGPGSIRQALLIGRDHGLVEIDDRMAPFLDESAARSEDADELSRALVAYLDCDVAELQGYSHYISEESPYSTQQGVKGTEYPDVLVVLDDDEGRHFQFSYDKLLGLKPPSATDLANQKAGKDTIIDRTRRLLYVCASRATRALAIVLYTDDEPAAIAALQSPRLSGTSEVITAAAVDARFPASTQ